MKKTIEPTKTSKPAKSAKNSTRNNKVETTQNPADRKKVAGKNKFANKNINSEETYFDKIGIPLQRAMNRALENVIKLGDTDVFPRSFEIAVIAESREDVLELLAKIHSDFQAMLISSPPVNDKVLSAVGYSGFRSVTQVDPIWNLYLLALVIYIAPQIESARVSADKDVVHSYRFLEDHTDSHVFNSEYGWFSFTKRCEQLARDHKYVLLTDISDFYPRIYHHRLENALKKVTAHSEVVKRIVILLSEFSGGVSYGLPVGGPASRLLSELLLNATDRLMLGDDVKYARFVDDFRIFSESKEEAHASLVLLAQKIGESEGLSLQKSKTRIMSSEEFLALIGAHEGDGDRVDHEHAKYRKFMSLKLHYDPYSESAKEDYEQLRTSLREFDIIGMLAREMKKTQIEEGVVRKLIRAVRHLDTNAKSACVVSLSDNLEVLSPVFPLAMQIFVSTAREIHADSRDRMLIAVQKLFATKSHIVQVAVNQAFAVRALALAMDEDSERILVSIYKTTSSIGVRRDIISVMANRDLAWFISDRRRNYQNLSSWERRAVIAASYILEDEGDHWRRKLTFNDFDLIVKKWVAKNKMANQGRVVLAL